MNKKIISAVLAAATALSLSASAFAATTTADPSHVELDVASTIASPVIAIKWPTNAGVALNPYKMKVTPTVTAGKIDVKDDASKGTDDTIICPDLVIDNSTGTSSVSIIATASVVAYTTVDKNGDPLKDKDGNPTTSIAVGDAKAVVADLNTDGTQKTEADGTTLKWKAATPAALKTSFVSAAIKQPTWVKDSKGEYKLQAGETKNAVLLCLVGAVSTGTNTYAFGDLDVKGENVLVLSNKEATKSVLTVAAKGKGCIKFRGDVATTPTIGWDQVKKTEGIKVNVIFDASPVAPIPEKPVDPAP